MVFVVVQTSCPCTVSKFFVTHVCFRFPQELADMTSTQSGHGAAQSSHALLRRSLSKETEEAGDRNSLGATHSHNINNNNNNEEWVPLAVELA